jgi:hypothetical protein
MKPFSAWLAMSTPNKPCRYDGLSAFGSKYGLYDTQTGADSFGSADAQRVLVIEDTSDNRRKLGMEVSK